MCDSAPRGIRSSERVEPSQQLYEKKKNSKAKFPSGSDNIA